MTEPFKARFIAPEGHHFTDPGNFAVLRDLFLELGIIGPDGDLGYDDIEVDDCFDDLEIDGCHVHYENTIGCGSDLEEHLCEFVIAYSLRFPTLRFRFIRVGDEGRVEEEIENGEICATRKDPL